MGRDHGPCSRPVNTGVQNDARDHGPWTRPVDTVSKNDTRVHGPLTRASFWTPVLTAVDTARDHGP